MLKGIDVSKWQKFNDYGDSAELGHTDFIIVKATEGKTYNDPMFEYHIAEAIRRVENYESIADFYEIAVKQKGVVERF